MKGILFKPDMIKAIVEKRKTVTRRVIKPQPFMERGVIRWQPKRGSTFNGRQGMHKPDINMDDHADLAKMFARFQVGEVVYIKEAWCEDSMCKKIHYKLDGGESPGPKVYYGKDKQWHNYKKPFWRSPLSMPAWAARYFIKILDVRPERLQEITEEDAEKEGFNCWEFDNPDLYADCPCLNQFILKWNEINARWKRVYNKELGIYEFWQFPRCSEDAKPIPKTTKHPERYHYIPNPWVFRYEFILHGGSVNDKL